MDIRKIKKLIELLEESSLTELEIVEGEESVRLMRGGQVQAMPFAQPQMIMPEPQMDQATKNLNANFSSAAIAKGEKKYGTSSERDFAAVPNNTQAIV